MPVITADDFSQTLWLFSRHVVGAVVAGQRLKDIAEVLKALAIEVLGVELERCLDLGAGDRYSAGLLKFHRFGDFVGHVLLLVEAASIADGTAALMPAKGVP
jgi:hypothetical protein